MMAALRQTESLLRRGIQRPTVVSSIYARIGLDLPCGNIQAININLAGSKLET
jgi:hypothetical protein